jgi:putative SOS response-associated peptidase YedK
MCGRYVSPEDAAIEREWELSRRNYRQPFAANFNVTPTTTVPIIRRTPDGALELAGARWGFIPRWWRKASPPRLTFNSRSEDVATLPTWREAYRASRCLMPALGWFEWPEVDHVDTETGEVIRARQPYFLRAPGIPVVAFAALWSTWLPPDGGEPTVSCALLTTAARGQAARVHTRMPVVLEKDGQDQWLDPTAGAQSLADLASDSHADFIFYPVRSLVNDRRSEGPRLIEPCPPEEFGATQVPLF